MSVTPYRTSTDLLRPFFEDMFGGPVNGDRLGQLLRAPVADVIETENEIRVTAEMPGLSPEDVSVDIENSVLTISGEKREERTEGEDRSTWHLTERRYGHFSRSFVLPREVDSDAIRASFENGILEVTVPKSEKARRRRIEIQSSGERQTVHTGA